MLLCWLGVLRDAGQTSARGRRKSRLKKALSSTLALASLQGYTEANRNPEQSPADDINITIKSTLSSDEAIRKSC